VKRLAVIGLACLLTACQSRPDNLLEGPPEQTANFSTRAADHSDCVYRFAESTRSAYLFHILGRADNQEFWVTATGSNAATVPKLPKLELHFIAQGETTIVELRHAASGDHELSATLWGIVDRCARQVGTPSAATPTAP